MLLRLLQGKRGILPAQLRYVSSSKHPNNKLPLEGILVVTLEQAVAAPLCTARLADDGARVIKIERSTGDFARHYDSYANGQSSYFTWINRGKESVVMDVKDEQDRQLLDAILSKADVFVQNLAPGATSRLNLGAEDLKIRYPNLISVDITGYGMSGPKKDYKAYDLLVAAEAGLCSITGTPDSPGRPGASFTDILTGLNAYSAILRALYTRDVAKQNPGGTNHHISLFDSIAETMNVPYLQTVATGIPPKRMGVRHPSIVPYGDFMCKDGKSLVISVQNNREWKQLCDVVLQRPELVRDDRFQNPEDRVLNRDQVMEIVEHKFLNSNSDELVQLLQDAGVAFGALNTVTELVEHSQLRTVEYETENGNVRVIANPIQSPWDSARGIQRVPKLGEHTAKVRKEFMN